MPSRPNRCFRPLTRSEQVERAIDAGGTLDGAVTDKDYGGRVGSVLDPEGNHWSFGSYQPR